MPALWLAICLRWYTPTPIPISPLPLPLPISHHQSLATILRHVRGTATQTTSLEGSYGGVYGVMYAV